MNINEKYNTIQIETINNIENILISINNRLKLNKNINGDGFIKKRYDESFKQNYINLIKELNKFAYLSKKDGFQIQYFNIADFTVKCKFIISSTDDIIYVKNNHGKNNGNIMSFSEEFIIRLSEELLQMIGSKLPNIKNKYILYLKELKVIEGFIETKNNKENMSQDGKSPAYGFRVKELKNKLVRLSEQPEEKEEGEKMSPIYPNMTDKDANSIYFEIQKYIKEFPDEEGLQDVKDEFESGKNKAAGIKYWYKKLYNAFNKREGLRHIKGFKNFK